MRRLQVLVYVLFRPKFPLGASDCAERERERGGAGVVSRVGFPFSCLTFEPACLGRPDHN